VGDFSLAGLRIYVKDSISPTVDLRECLNAIFGSMPKNIYSNIHTIMIGDFSFLKNRKIDATYSNGIVYVTNKHTDNYDFISDVLHELAHAFEEKHKNIIYGDNEIKEEFLAKRKMLFNVVNANNVFCSLSQEDFLNPKYDLKFDYFLYEEVGYEKLFYLTKDIFVSPYGATSLREYFANAFENFFVNDIFLVKKYAPSVYKKLIKYLEI
jgi:hypothetical protein